MFKKILALVLATMMVLGGMVTVSAAEEAPAATAVDYDAIYQASAEDLAALDILKGSIVDNKIDFALENGVTRWQMALFVARIMTGETNDQYWNKVNDNDTPFEDVNNYFGAISYAYEQGIINGRSATKFDPNAGISYAEALTMAVRALGYKQLQYPQGFITVAGDLGLTDGLEELAIDTKLTRGQMVQILKNMLYVKVDGAESFAAQNFGLEETVYVIVATELQYMLGADRVYRVDYEGEKANEQTKYVALAPLNADGTYNLDAIIHLTEEELGLAQRESETKIGYSYTIYSYDNYAGVYNVVANDTKTVKNYGDEGKIIAAGTKYNNVSDSIVKIDGTTYKLVESFTDLNNKSTYTNKQPELIVHSLYKGDADITSAYYLYDVAGNILNPANGEVALTFNRWSNTYYVEVLAADGETSLGYRVATEDDFAAYAINNDIDVDQYGIVTSASELTTVSFSEITLIDDNNDGVYDRAVYIPYSVGKYTTSNKAYAWIVANSKDSGSTKKTVSYVNGEDLCAWATNTSGVWGYQDLIQQSDIFFLGEGRPASGEYVVYYYNPYSRNFTVVENLGKPVSGTVQALTQGSYAYDSTNKTYYYNGATVTIDGETYKLGYRPYETAKQYGADLLTIDASLANYGYDEVLYGALVGNTYKKMSYLVLAGRVILASDAGNACGWMAFDYGTYAQDPSVTYTSYDYTGDIIGVDADGNILVKAYVDKTGEAQIVKIGSINGFSYGLLVEDYAALQYQFSGIGILGTNALDTMKKIVIADFFKTLTADLGGTQRQYVYIVTGVSDDGVYEIYTDLNLYWGNAGMSYRQPSWMKQTATITFMNGISTDKVWTNSSTSDQYALVLDAESVILVAGKDGMKVKTGVPANGATINFKNAAGERDAYAYSISNDFIFVASKNMTCDEIYTGKDWDATATTGGYTYYMVLGRQAESEYEANTAASAAYDAEQNAIVYTYTNMYNLNTGAYETISVVGGLEEYNTATGIFGLNNPKPIGAIYAEKNGVYTLLTKDLVEMTYTSGLYSVKYQSAKDSMKVLQALLVGGYTDAATGKSYEAIYESVDSLGGAAPIANVINLGSGTVYDAAVSFKFDLITYVADKDTGIYTDIRLTQNDRASTNNHSGAAIFYTYEEGVSFVATAIAGQGAAVEGDIAAAVLAAAKAAAKADLNAAAGASAACKAIAAAAAEEIDGAADEAAIDAIVEEALIAIFAQKKVENDQAQADKDAAAEAATRAALKAELEALLADTDAAILAGTIKDGSAYTVEDHIDSWISVVATAEIAAIEAAIDEAEARIAALAAAAEAAAPSIAISANAITTKNLIGGTNAVAVYKLDGANGYVKAGEITWTGDVAAATGIFEGAKVAKTWDNDVTVVVTITFEDDLGNTLETTAFAADTTYAVTVETVKGAKTVEGLTIAG